jgi:hypothetical protein
MKITVGVVVALAAVLTACASGGRKDGNADKAFYELATGGCSERGREMIVTGEVRRAKGDTLEMWDGDNSERTVSIHVPDAGGVVEKVRGALGTSKHEAAMDALDELADEDIPVTATLLCQGPDARPQALRLSYVDKEGERQSIDFD